MPTSISATGSLKYTVNGSDEVFKVDVTNNPIQLGEWSKKAYKDDDSECEVTLKVNTKHGAIEFGGYISSGNTGISVLSDFELTKSPVGTTITSQPCLEAEEAEEE